MNPTAHFGLWETFLWGDFLKKLFSFLSYVLVAAAAAAVTMALCGHQVPPQEASQTSKLDELRNLIESCFVGEVDAEALEDGAAAGMIDALGDRWSYYMNAEAYAAYKEQMANAYVGIGTTVTLGEDGYVHILKVEDGSPALEAGVEPGDVIIAVEGQDIQGQSLTDVKTIIRGPEGTQVNLTIRRGDAAQDLTITRRQIQVVVAKGQMLEDGIGLVQIVNFDKRCANETIAVIEELLAQGAQSLIFDVRYNPGGYKDELVKLLDYLLPEGPLFRSVHYTGATEVDQSDAKCLDIPMAVLINGDCYSAAEFFAAALSEYDMAVMVGEPTVGKGYFQTSFELSDGSAVVLSIGKYTTPNDVSLTGVGLTPDITVDVDDTLYMEIYYGNVAYEADPQIQAAIEALKAG